MISVQQVAIILGGVNCETASKWLKKNGIQIHKLCKEKSVFQIEVDVTIDKLHVKDLMRKNPHNWEEKYQIIAKDKAVCQLVIEELKGESWRSPATIVKPITESDNKLLKRLKA